MFVNTISGFASSFTTLLGTRSKARAWFAFPIIRQSARIHLNPLESSVELENEARTYVRTYVREHHFRVFEPINEQVSVILAGSRLCMLL